MLLSNTWDACFVLVDGAFTTYTNYSTCSKTCGGGVQVRLRSCTNPEPQFGGKNCTGTYKETKSCNAQPCPGKYSLPSELSTIRN